MERSRFRQLFSGVSLSLALGAAIWVPSKLLNWPEPLAIGIICGMVLRTLMGERPRLLPGLDWTPTLLIPAGIILYGANLRFDFKIVPPLIWLQIVIGVVIVIWICSSLGSALKIKVPTSLLVAIGTAICGASAIMIARSAVRADNRDTATALLVITIWGLLGLFGLPYLAGLLDMDTVPQAQLFATTLQQTGFVKAAAAHVGPVCLNIAVTIKLARTLMIIPALLALGTLSHFLVERAPDEEKQPFQVRIPWYLWAFLASGLMFSFIPFLSPFAPYVKNAASLMWTMAMVSIGLTVDIREIGGSLFRPVVLGLAAWLSLLAIFFYTYFNTM
jgi:uncharacterized integral membrane protein (TIGR00698 family)